MSKKLVIVESPAKARTIKNFLGSDYDVQASIGHIRDLAENKSELPDEFQKMWWADYSVDVDNEFDPKYVVPKDKQEQVRKLRSALKDADTLVLATDEDREGESISWHLIEVLKPKKGVPIKRIAFHEITREAIQEALNNPRDVDQNLVRAQETRRILDRLYGYTLSPVLWRLGRGRGLSAGRVQSPAVKLVVERELERRRFTRASYWDLKAILAAGKQKFDAQLVEVSGQRIASGKEDFDSTTGQLKNKDRLLLDETRARGIAKAANSAEPWTVTQIEQRPEQRRPYPPFMTSTLQQEANRKLGFPAERTMRVAQDLYEGIEASGVQGGLITYMRTDSLNLADSSIKQIRGLIKDKFGDKYLPGKANAYQSKVNNAQEAHEAIRPTDANHSPEMIAERLGRSGRYSDHIRLYELIWKRTVACQMSPAELMITTAKIAVTAGPDPLVFQSNGKSIQFPGFLRAYVEGTDDPEGALEDQERILPNLTKGQNVDRESVEALGHETRPPARYTDATLVKALEERGIGRPSTYAAILKTIADREYVRKKNKEIIPTFMAFLVTEVLDHHFAEFSNLSFTTEMDRVLDSIANGKENWKTYLKEFFIGNDETPGLKPAVDERKQAIRRPVFEVGQDPISGESITVQFGRNGFFLVRGEMETGSTASVPEDMAPADLTVEEALQLLEKKARGPETIGIDPVTGRNLLLKNRNGYYLETERTAEELEKKVKPRWISIPPGVDPTELTPELLDGLCQMPRDLGKNPENSTPVLVKIGKFGSYLDNGSETRTIEDWHKALTINLEEALEILKQPKVGRGQSARVAAGPIKEFGALDGSSGPVRILAGRYGPYVTDGTTNATLPKGLIPEEVTAEQAIELIKTKAAAGPAPKRRFARKSSGGSTKKKPATRAKKK
ncbi:MAG TPA: type I DNA topoisomerase [Fimbriimonadaceae bacterium]|jgi:DNA topoisomerase-1